MMTLAGAIETTCIHSIASLMGDRTTFATMRKSHGPYHMTSEVGRIGGEQVPPRGQDRWPTMVCFLWMYGRNSGATCLRCCASRRRMR
jgi:hypothetical protein